MNEKEKIKKATELHKSSQEELDLPTELSDSKDTLLYDVDVQFAQIYNKGLELSNTPDRGEKRYSRFYNLVQLLRSSLDLKGEIIECGAWRGLSSYLMCKYIQRELPHFTGSGYHIVDSFQGLSEPGPKDVIDRDLVLKGKDRRGMAFKTSGAYAATLNHVQQVLKEYPDIKYYESWIPEVLDTLPKYKYRFVHIDLDIYNPILEALNYFYPRMVSNGIIVCDDYGSLFWPGAKKAIEIFCSQNNLRFFSLTTGQAVIIKRKDGYFGWL